MGSPEQIIDMQINEDTNKRNCYHSMCYKGNYDCMVTMLNIERVYRKKILFEQLLRYKNSYRFKNMDIKHGKLATSVFHDSETVKRFEDFNIHVLNLFEKYSQDVVNRYRQILFEQDAFKRNPTHYGAMNKFTNSNKTLEAVLSIDIDHVPGMDQFLKLFFQIQDLENKEE